MRLLPPTDLHSFATRPGTTAYGLCFFGYLTPPLINKHSTLYSTNSTLYTLHSTSFSLHPSSLSRFSILRCLKSTRLHVSPSCPPARLASPITHLPALCNHPRTRIELSGIKPLPLPVYGSSIRIAPRIPYNPPSQWLNHRHRMLCEGTFEYSMEDRLSASANSSP